MPAGLTSTDTMFSVRETPWHGLGAVLERPPATIAEAIELSGLGWSVEKEPIAVDRGEAAAEDFMIPRCEEIPDFYATVRQDTREVLGIVGPRYEIVQNYMAFQFVDQLLGSAMHFETAGSLHGGRRVWVLATLPDHIEVGGDAVRPFVLLSNSHDGSSALLAATTPVRVVCQNTLSISVSRARQRMALRHTGHIRRRVHEARRVLDLAVNYYAHFRGIGNQLASERCTERQLRNVLDELYPSGTTDTSITDRTRRSREETKQRITELFLRGDTVGNAPGSKWVALNAVVEHMDWRPVRDGTERFARTIDSTAAKTKVLELITRA
jgi:phage/plasmid-like protein (TIGR03299 family)